MKKYIKGTQKWKIWDANTKVRFTDTEWPSENIWAYRNSEDRIYIALNNALMFMPYFSWGAVVTKLKSYEDIDNLEEIELHPEAWDYYIKQWVIDEEWNFIKKD